METQRVICDVLCVGGGIAGLMAAIAASENGAVKVVVAEKSNTMHSGAAGMGNDHFQCYIPDVHGDYEAFANDLLYGQFAGRISAMGREAMDFWFKNSYEIVKLWESWGIPMKYEGRYEFAGHSFPGQTLNHLKYSGFNQKPILTKQAREHSVEILNRVMVFDLITDGQGKVIGALGISTREDKLIEFEAKSVILGTGPCVRMWPAPGLQDFNRPLPPSCTGDGRAMAYRAGAELVDLELTAVHAGPKYLARAGQATWIGVLRDRYDKPVGTFLTKPNRYYNDMTLEVNKGIFNEYIKSGKGPIYMDTRGMSEEDLQYMLYWMKHEGNIELIKHLAEEGIDLRKNAVEFMTYDMHIVGGIPYNSKGQTSLEGLYAAGDEWAGGISCAAVFGWSAGKNAALYATSVTSTDLDKVKTDINTRKEMLQDLRSRKDGPKWQEANYALQQIMRDYCYTVKSEPLLEAGLETLIRLKEKTHQYLMAENPHELMHCLEVFNLLDLAELVFVGSLDRKETRGINFIRPDYILTNPMLDAKRHLIRKGPDGLPVTEWRKI
ncbi:FAD-binding protein [Moorella sulfitireducens]|uniref:FAD-binding protein n=1 Tax=Neomoorella sulfitireducens TaxID=2972948 RepID=UPI0021ACCBDB|nr:FAD-binding protein [Moorella sulfitireducens]